MCDPVSALMGAQAVIGAAGALSAGSAQAKAHSANAGALEVQRTNRLEKAKFDVAQKDRAYRRVAGARDAGIGASGVTADSFTDIAADDSMESALEKAAIMWSAENEANMLQFQADAQRKQASSVRTASYFNAASAVLNAAGRYVKSQSYGVKAGSTFSPDANYPSGYGEDTYG